MSHPVQLRIQAMPPDIRRFSLLKSIAQLDACWRSCSHAECRRRKLCTGGPRGTMRATRGIPRCRLGASDQWWEEIAGPLFEETQS